MKSSRLLLAFALGLGLTSLVFVALTARPAQAIVVCNRYVVNPTGVDSGTCGSPNTPCRTVRYALRQAGSGERICVADNAMFSGPSVYTGTNIITRSVTLDGGWSATCGGPPPTCNFTSICAPQNVVLDAQGAGRTISITGNITPTIRCFTITGGDAVGLRGDPDGDDAGGGIYSKDAAPVIANNIITGNYGCNVSIGPYGRGGGIYLLNAPATALITGNVIVNNSGSGTILGSGGGIALRNSRAQVLSNTIQHNAGGTVGNGGGIIVIDGSPVIADNRVLTNTAGAGVLCAGGGIYVSSSAPVTIERNLIQDNRALFGTGSPGFTSQGGGIYYNGAAAYIHDNTVYRNTGATGGLGAGGGMYLRNLSASALVNGNTVRENRASYFDDSSGGGIYLDMSAATVADNAIFGNTAASSSNGWGGGVYINGGGGLIQGNTITNNLALLGAVTGYGWGGGMAISNSLAVAQDNWIAQNQAASAPSSSGAGGGVYVYLGAPQIRRNHILTNTTGAGSNGFGGGFFLDQTSPWLDGNTILNNRAAGTALGRGGGVRIASCPAFTLTNNIVARNIVSTTGSGVAVAASTGRLDYNTVADNLTGDGVGVRADSSSSVILTNNIIANQTVGISNTGSVVNAQYTLFDGNGQNYKGSVTSANEVPGPAGLRSDYHLKSWSGAIDRGLPLSWATADIDGDPRPLSSGYDVGADEASCNRFVLNTDGSDASNDCGSMFIPCRTVQRALNQAADGDMICVADNPLQAGPSIYTGTHTINKSVTLDGAWQASCAGGHLILCSFWSVPCSPANVVLDALGAGSVISITGNVTPTVRCFTLTGGDADEGAGINVNGANVIIASNVITNNVAGSYGGGINVGSGNAVITANAILSNSAVHGGGGLEMIDATVVLGNNRISQNSADYGGGLELDRASVTATANLVNYNQSSSAWMVSGAGNYKLVVVNNAVVNNEGAALRIYNYRADLAQNTIVSNTGAAVEGYFTATLVLTNNVIAYNSGAGIVTGAGSSAIASYSLFWSNSSDPITGTNAVLADPLLAADGYHLTAGSPAINHGVPTWVTTDIDGDQRLGLPDIGADEYVLHVYLPLILRN